MIPIGDDNRYRLRPPVVSGILIGVNILVFVFFQKFGRSAEFLYSFGMIPGEILSGRDIVTESRIVVDPSRGLRYLVSGLGVTPIPVYLTIFTSMFMHGGLLHIAGNMLFLAIFGDNIEDHLGHVRFLAFYLLSGIAAALVHVGTCAVMGEGLLSPTVGASGAISGVMAAYLRLFPGNRVRVLLFNIIPTTLSAFLVIGFWFVLQLVNGFGSGTSDGVAYAAHIGGFLFGLIFIKAFVPRKRRPGKVRYRIIKD